MKDFMIVLSAALHQAGLITMLLSLIFLVAKFLNYLITLLFGENTTLILLFLFLYGYFTALIFSKINVNYSEEE